MSQFGIYRVGYSFKNPSVVTTATKVRRYPYFGIEWAAKGPTQVKEELFRRGVLRRYSPVWRRRAKNRVLSKLRLSGLRSYKKEVPSFSELGQAPGPTSREALSSRNVWGFLDSIVKSIGDVVSERQKLEMLRIQSSSGVVSSGSSVTYIPSESTGVGTFPVIAMVVGAGVLAYLIFRR